MNMRERIAEKLQSAFAPATLDVIDESHQHFGHAGWKDGGETHFRVRIATRHFDGLGRVAQHRLINAALADEFSDGVHALAIEIVPVQAS